jgi:hypothetical protein
MMLALRLVLGLTLCPAVGILIVMGLCRLRLRAGRDVSG